jgi:hypothetical protein
MEGSEPPKLPEERRLYIVNSLNGFDEVDILVYRETGVWPKDNRKRKWQFAESLNDEDEYYYASCWIQNQ